MGNGLKRAQGLYRSPEGERSDFADPPRSWGRVASMAAGWAAVLLLGAWMAPGFASSGDEEELPASEQPPADPNDAAWVFLTTASSEDLGRADEVICRDADPEVSSSELDQVRQAYSEELGGITRIDVSTDDPVGAGEQWTVDATVNYVSDGRQTPAHFRLTVERHDDEYCVANVVEVDPEGSADSGDVRDLVTGYLTTIFMDRRLEAAEDLHCENFEGLDLEDLDRAGSAWEVENGEAQRYLERGSTESNSRDGGGLFTYNIVFDAMKNESFEFQVLVEEGCVSQFDGGAGLLALLEE